MPGVNRLYEGDNLTVLRERVPDDSVDLIYLDPPFNSRRDYQWRNNKDSKMPVAFGDTWRWDENRDQELSELEGQDSSAIAGFVRLVRDGMQQPDTAAYLTFMAIRLLEMRRVLKHSGSLYLHCDPSAAHYLKILLDGIFCPENFRNEIIWHYSGWNARLKNALNSRHDVILFYAMETAQLNFNGFALPWDSESDYVRIRKQKIHQDAAQRKYVLSDGGNGKRVRRFLDEAMAYGKPVDDVWDLPKINNSAREALGYPTQKPLELLSRIIQASSNAGDVVLDPFCGSGTTLHAAASLERHWIGIDASPLAVALAAKRLEAAVPGLKL